jgi:hypothetical protein
MKRIVLALTALVWLNTAQAQHEGHTHEHKKETKKKAAKEPAKTTDKKTTPAQKPATAAPATDAHAGHQHGTDTVPKKAAAPTGHAGHDHGAAPGAMQHDDHATHTMSHLFSRNLSMNRNGSGTGWLPDNAPMNGYMFMPQGSKWMYMLHSNIFLRYNKQDLLDKGSRGDTKFDAPNWAMGMAQRPVGQRGQIAFKGMVSLDPLFGGDGYPLLFQTGEAYKGEPLIDRQHPHDLISELAVGYTHMLSPKSDVFLYVGYPGEPAIGPVAFMHRPSALQNPDAPLSHHWVDATHITFGVATLGVRYGAWKVEGSSFTGREPDEHRYNFDKPRFDSWSGRLSFNPSARWALQASHAFIKEPEELHPGEDVNRTTASATFGSRGYGNEFVSITGLWGMNKTKGHDAEHAALLEGSYVQRRLGLFSRYEWVQKSAEELGLEHGYGFEHDAIFPVHAFTAGVNYDLFSIGQTRIAGGGQLTFFAPDDRLAPLYGQNPLGGQVFLRIYPGVLGQRAGALALPY